MLRASLLLRRLPSSSPAAGPRPAQRSPHPRTPLDPPAPSSPSLFRGGCRRLRYRARTSSPPLKRQAITAGTSRSRGTRSPITIAWSPANEALTGAPLAVTVRSGPRQDWLRASACDGAPRDRRFRAAAELLLAVMKPRCRSEMRRAPGSATSSGPSGSPIRLPPTSDKHRRMEQIRTAYSQKRPRRLLRGPSLSLRDARPHLLARTR